MSRLRLALRRMQAERAALAGVAVLVLVAVAVVAAWPRAADTLLTTALRQQVAAAGPALRDLTADLTEGGPQAPGGAAADWAALPSVARDITRALPPSLAALAGTTRWWGRSDGPPGAAFPGVLMRERAGMPNGTLAVSFEADPGLRSDAVLVSGTWPSGRPSRTAALPVAVTTTTAARLGWSLGTVVHRAADGSTVRITGLVRPRTPLNDLWQADPLRDAPVDRVDPQGGLHWQGLAFVASGAWPVESTRFGSAHLGLLVPLAASPSTVHALTPAGILALRRGFSAVGAAQFTLGRQAEPFSLSTDLPGVLDGYEAAATPVSALLAVLLTGPAAALAVLVWLAGIGVVGGRRRADRLTALRGAGGGGPRTALDLLAVSAPAAAAGAVLAVLLTPHGAGSPLPAAIAGAALPPLTALVATPRPGGAWRRRARLLGGTLVLAFAALASVVLLQRGVRGTDPDPVAVAAPLCVVVAASVPVLLLLPRLVRAAGRLGAGRGVVGLLGSRVTASRTATATVVALVAAIGIAGVASAVLATARAGIADAAVRTVGADLLVTAPALPADADARIAHLVARSATIDRVGAAAITTPSAGDVQASVFAADPAAVAAVQRSAPAADRTFAALVRGGALAVAVGLRGRTDLEVYTDTADVRVPLDSVPVTTPPADLTTEAYWVVVDRAALPASLARTARPVALLAALPPGADAASAAAGVRAALPGSSVVTAAAVAAATTASPLVGGLVTAALASAALGALAAALALAVTLVDGSRDRTRLAAMLRAIGLAPRQSAALVLWDAVPVALVCLVAGLAVGAGAAALLLVPVDLAPLIGSSTAPPFAIDPLLEAAVAGVALAAAALGTAGALVAIRRADTASVLRFQEGAT